MIVIIMIIIFIIIISSDNNEQIDQICSNMPSSSNAHANDEDRSSAEPEKMWSPVFRLLSTRINRDEWKNVMRSLFGKIFFVSNILIL